MRELKIIPIFLLEPVTLTVLRTTSSLSADKVQSLLGDNAKVTNWTTESEKAMPGHPSPLHPTNMDQKNGHVDSSQHSRSSLFMFGEFQH